MGNVDPGPSYGCQNRVPKPFRHPHIHRTPTEAVCDFYFLNGITLDGMEKGNLILLPVTLGEGGLQALPQYAIDRAQELTYFIAERPKSARQFLKQTGFARSLQELHMEELNKHTPPEDIPRLLEPALAGHDLGLLSEAGCPAVADPGALLVRAAHQLDIPVRPLVGPSSILLALIASGMNGQQFGFHGYLSPKKQQLGQELRRLERDSGRFGQTQLFMETPYRNDALVLEALKHLRPDTLFGIAAELTLPGEYIKTHPVSQWREQPPPSLHKRPAVFSLLAR
jgi:16S rRNA (cytidine1402-2'-O)-methyltransferase